MIQHQKRFTLFLILALLWMGVIFYKSSQPYVEQDMKPWLHGVISEQTLLTILPHIEFSYNDAPVTYKQPYNMAEFFIRKLGHLSEYALLALLYWNMLKATTLRRLLAWILSWLLVALYASTDEYHQTFVAGRTGHPGDVVLDSCGALLFLIFPLLFLLFKKAR